MVRTVADVAAISRGEAEIFELVRDGEYAEALTAREIHLNGSADMGIHENGDLLLFVREGSGTLTVAGKSFELSPDCAALIRDGEAWALSSTSPSRFFQSMRQVWGHMPAKSRNLPSVFNAWSNKGSRIKARPPATENSKCSLMRVAE